MAFNSYFPQGYPYYQPVQQTPLQTQPAASAGTSNGLNWVQGIEAAKSFPVAPGSTVLLLDSENNSMYIKSADQSGMPSMRIFEYTEVTGREHAPKEPEHVDMSMYVTHDELEKALAALTQKKKEAKKDA